jgi:hypothetical protein
MLGFAGGSDETERADYEAAPAGAVTATS